jgi:hypothetical protein
MLPFIDNLFVKRKKCVGIKEQRYTPYDNRGDNKMK